MERTEDEVRDEAKIILGFDKKEPGIQQGTGQITTFNQLGFKGVSDKPDGWYLPNDLKDVAIVLETKSEKEDLANTKWVEEIYKNVRIVARKYNHAVGILYNGKEVRTFKHAGVQLEQSLITVSNDPDFEEVKGCAPALQGK